MEMIGSHAEQLNKVLIMKDDINADIKRGELRSIVQLTDVIVEAPAKLIAFQKPKS